MTESQRKLVVIAGPNGAGKSTLALRWLRGPLAVTEFVNGDLIARGISAVGSQQAAFAAGRILRARLRVLAAAGVDFGFETTLATKSYVPWIIGLKARGYSFELVFLWLPSPDLAVNRVRERVRLGGHDVPEATVRRRYDAGLRNFFRLYRSIADRWTIVDNSPERFPSYIASGSGKITQTVVEATTWADIRNEWDN